MSPALLHYCGWTDVKICISYCPLLQLEIYFLYCISCWMRVWYCSMYCSVFDSLIMPILLLLDTHSSQTREYNTLLCTYWLYTLTQTSRLCVNTVLQDIFGEIHKIFNNCWYSAKFMTNILNCIFYCKLCVIENLLIYCT